MGYRPETIIHSRKRVVPGPTVQIPVRMCMMLLCHFPMNRPKIQQCCVQVNLESCTIGLQIKRNKIKQNEIWQFGIRYLKCDYFCILINRCGWQNVQSKANYLPIFNICVMIAIGNCSNCVHRIHNIDLQYTRKIWNAWMSVDPRCHEMLL